MTTEPLYKRRVAAHLRSLARTALRSPIPPTLSDLAEQGIPETWCVTVLRGLNDLREAKASGRGAKVLYEADELSATWAREFGPECRVPDRSGEVERLLKSIPRT